MSYVNILVHAVWATKYRNAVLTRENRLILFQHILQNSKEKEIHIDRIGGYVDHVHCLISLSREQNISKVIQLIKGESSFWVNKHKVFKPKLEWAIDYYAASISHSALTAVRAYIDNQEEHHRRLNFDQEVKAIFNKGKE